MLIVVAITHWVCLKSMYTADIGWRIIYGAVLKGQNVDGHSLHY